MRMCCHLTLLLLANFSRVSPVTVHTVWFARIYACMFVHVWLQEDGESRLREIRPSSLIARMLMTSVSTISGRCCSNCSTAAIVEIITIMCGSVCPFACLSVFWLDKSKNHKQTLMKVYGWVGRFCPQK